MFKLSAKRNSLHFLFLILGIALLVSNKSLAQQTIYNPEHSVARNWNEALLFAIRNDFARPTVHARNLFHTSSLMFDLWAIYDATATTYFLGDHTQLPSCAMNSAQKQLFIDNAGELSQARNTAISYGMYRLLTHRFANSPNVSRTQTEFVEMANFYQVDRDYNDADISSGNAADLGNYIANCVIEFGLNDGANEQNDYANSVYQPANEALDPSLSGNPNLQDADRWQPLKLDIFIDQAGNETDIPPFLGAEWGQVIPFALDASDLNVFERDGQQYWVYHDPGVPAWMKGDQALPQEYQWGHALVALWSSHLDPSDGVIWDISPRSIGSTTNLPESIEGLRDFYSSLEGGSTDQGHAINPYTSAPYQTQMVPRGDYTRVLAEFWADGPDSETPPGHWFSILNQAVSDHPAFEKTFMGQGDALDDLQWDVKAYFALGGAVHDAAVTAWGIKGWYDYVRPISAIRYMADLGQSNDSNLANYHEHGLPLVDGLIEMVEASDPLSGENNENVGKIKLFAWRGPDAISDPESDTAGVGWILAENWWPYQRPSFVTPPFAGYVSGHSTFSRAAAEVLTLLTGDDYFPGGMGEFVAKKDQFLVFEQGPSVDVTLQWATYRDASDQTSLSRIWGGIHPPVDDVPGRRIGIQVGLDAFALAQQYFLGQVNPLPAAPAPQPTSSESARSQSSGGGGSLLWLTCIAMAICLFRWPRKIRRY